MRSGLPVTVDVFPARPRVGRYTLTPWGPSIDRHAGRAWSREHLDQIAPPQGGAVGTSRRRCLGSLQGLEYLSGTYDWPRLTSVRP